MKWAWRASIGRACRPSRDRCSRTLLRGLVRGGPRIDQFLRLRSEPARLAELRLTSLSGNAFQARVVVECAGDDFIEAFDVPGPEVDTIDRADRETCHKARVTRHDQCRWSGKKIDAQTERIAKIRWSEEQQDQIRPIVYAPGVKGLTEIARLLWKAVL